MPEATAKTKQPPSASKAVSSTFLSASAHLKTPACEPFRCRENTQMAALLPFLHPCMASNPQGKDVQAYPPTSLDFINRPNPVEPLAAPPKHPLHGASQLHSAYTHDLRRLLLDRVPRDAAGEAAAKRLRSEDEGSSRSNGTSQARDLPSLPRLPVRSGSGSKASRRRLPPTLSGLHQPPPDAGLLPSISVQHPRQQTPDAQVSPSEVKVAGTSNDTRVLERNDRSEAEKPVLSAVKSKSKKPAKNKWSEQETADLLKGVAKFGIGSWSKILKCEEFSFNRRTALDLKDRFRVCCPEHYRKPKAQSQSQHDNIEGSVSKYAKPNDRKGASDLARLGIEQPFQKSTRRSRHGYTKEQDDALYRGFLEHGKSWAAIQKDEKVLAERTPTDLRDRFRLKYPKEYAAAGLAPRPEVFPQPPDRGSQAADTQDSSANRDKSTSEATANADVPVRSEQPNLQPADSSSASRPYDPHVSLPNDVFLGIPADDEDMDTEPLTLDRGILDWAFETTKLNNQESSNSRGEYAPPPRASGTMPASSSSFSNTGNASALLPSLATITAVSDDSEQLELPSLMQYFSSIEGDSRSGGNSFLSFEELLSQS